MSDRRLKRLRAERSMVRASAVRPNSDTGQLRARGGRSVGVNGKYPLPGAMAARGIVASRDEHRVERVIDRLPVRMQRITRWLRQPSSRWVRLPAGVLLIGGAGLSILPFFGLWMLPLGLMLLAEDVPPLRRMRDRVLERVEHRRPHWFKTGEPAGGARR
jgi:hypothetical protein